MRLNPQLCPTSGVGAPARQITTKPRFSSLPVLPSSAVNPSVAPPNVSPNAVTVVLSPSATYAPQLNGAGSRLTVQAPGAIQSAIIDGIDAGITPGGSQITLTANRAYGTALVTWIPRGQQSIITPVYYGAGPTRAGGATATLNLPGAPTIGWGWYVSGSGAPGDRIILNAPSSQPSSSLVPQQQQFISPVYVDGVPVQLVSSNEATLVQPGVTPVITTRYWSGVIVASVSQQLTPAEYGVDATYATATYTIYYGP